MARKRMTKGESQKLARIRSLYEETVDHMRNARAEMHRAGRYYHNTRGEGQWEPTDAEALRQEGRAMFSFNISREKVDAVKGIYGDAQRWPMVLPSGAEDELAAEALDILKEQTLQEAHFEAKSARTFKGGTIYGECGLQVEVVPHPDNPLWIKINIHRVPSLEIAWDAGSCEPDRSDANHFFWGRWMSRSEFERWYPEYAKDFDALANSSEPSDEVSGSSNVAAETSIGTGSDLNAEYEIDDNEGYYYDRHKHKARVIRYEYKTNVREYFVVDPTTQQARPVNREQRRELEALIRDMDLQVELFSVLRERIHVCEFIGNRILAEYDSPGPFTGFSVSDFCYDFDDEEGVPYGALRNLFDPQQELNKSKTREIELIANGPGGGVIAEEDAIISAKQFKRARTRADGIAWVTEGSLTAGRVQENQAHPIPPALIARQQSALELADRISGIPSHGVVTPASQAEAASTVALRHNKARQSVADPIGNFERCIQECVTKVVEAIARAMPDDQMEATIGNESKYRVQNGMVIEVAQGPQGQVKPVKVANISDVRKLKNNVELEIQSDNTMLRMVEFETMLSLAQAGVPVDPELLVEAATSSRSRRERLKQYVEKMQASQAQGAQAQSEMQKQQLGLMAAMQKAELDEERRSNQADEALQAEKQARDYQVSIFQVWEKADAAEKAALRDLLKFEEQQQIRAAQVQPGNRLPV